MTIRQIISHAEDEESYFVSMTDIVIGLLFIFIIMLMYFAMRFQQASTEKETVTRKQEALIEHLTEAEATRASILENLKQLLERDGIDVLVVKDEGILRLPEKLLFNPSSWEIRNTTPIKALGRALNQILPCYTVPAEVTDRHSDCPTTEAKIEAIFIEGHADLTQFRDVAVPSGSGAPSQQPSTGQRLFSNSSQQPQVQPDNAAIARRLYILKDNLDLSAIRATSTFRELLRAQPELANFLSPERTPILGVSGYGSSRPLIVESGETAEAYKQRLRRIDLRILMATPKSETAKQMQEQLERTDKP